MQLYIELRLIYQEIGLLKDENLNQNHQIIEMLLQMMRSSTQQWRQGNHHQLLEKNEEPIDHQMKKDDSDEFLLTSSDGDPHQDSSRKDRLKRPARLLPLQLLYGDRKNETDQQIRRFYGPPTNCTELSMLGYTLNGYYLVKIADITKETKLETVYCAFKQSDGTFNPSGSEKRGARLNSDIQTSNKKFGGGIHFYALMVKSDFNAVGSGNLTFGLVYLNMGYAFNEKKGTFTAPKNGVYQFIFKGTTKQGETSTKVVIVLNRNGEWMGATLPASGVSTVLMATLKLTKGDTIDLQSKYGSLSFHEGAAPSFSGSLLEELD